MERRQFLGTSLALGTAGGTLLGPARAPARRAQGGVIRLDANENPLGISPLARQAILENLAEANRYPRAPRTALIDALARKHGCTADEIQLGTGSTEILQMAVQATPEGAFVVTADPTFEEVGRFAASAGRRSVRVPLRADGSHDIPAMRVAAGSGPSLVFICNPNNPTATLTACDEVEAWIAASDARTVFMIDEAYFEFVEAAGYRSAERLALSRPNVVVVRTFSKIHAMAGLRLGYALAQADTIRRLRQVAVGNNANNLVLVAAVASLGDRAWQDRALANNRASRTMLLRALDDLGLAYMPTQANFVMHRIPGELGAYNARMRDAGFLVGRLFPTLRQYSRVSFGLPEEMTRFTETLRAFRARSWV